MSNPLAGFLGGGLGLAQAYQDQSAQRQMSEYNDAIQQAHRYWQNQTMDNAIQQWHKQIAMSHPAAEITDNHGNHTAKKVIESTYIERSAREGLRAEIRAWLPPLRYTETMELFR